MAFNRLNCYSLLTIHPNTQANLIARSAPSCVSNQTLTFTIVDITTPDK